MFNVLTYNRPLTISQALCILIIFFIEFLYRNGNEIRDALLGLNFIMDYISFTGCIQIFIALLKAQ